MYNKNKKLKPQTAQDLLEWLLALKENYDLKKVMLNHRESDNDDVTQIASFGEDLYDAETNSILESICFYGIE